jgi:hypothetical protein
MAAAEHFVYSGSLTEDPRRPALDDVGGASKEDDQVKPPDPVTMPCADDWNQIAQLAAYYGQVLPVAVVSVTYTTGTPVVSYFGAIDPNLTGGSVTPTDNGDGDTTLSWAADTFPATNLNPAGLTLNESTAVERMSAVPVVNGVRVRTLDGSGTGVDCAFTIYLHGQYA